MASDLYKVCQQSDYSNAFRNYFAFSQTDDIIIYCLVPISLICAILNIYFFYKFPNVRQPPFDILLFVTVLSIINSAVYLSTVIYNTVHPISRQKINNIPDDFNSFCLITGTMHFFVQIGITVYNTIFCLYYTCKIKNPLKCISLCNCIAWVRENKEVHGLCLVLIILATIVINVSNQIGVSALGVCGLKVAKSSIFLQLAMFLMYIIVLIITSVFFLKYLNQIGRFDIKARLFFKYYLLYVLLISTIYILQCTTIIFLIVDCFTGISQVTYQVFAKCGNILALLTPVASTIIICFHPQFTNKLMPILCNLCKSTSKNNQYDRQQFYNNLMTTTNRTSQIKNNVMIQLSTINVNNQGYLSSIKQYNRLSILSTVLGCISLFISSRKDNNKLINRSSVGSSQDDHIFSWNYTDKYELKIDQDMVQDNKKYFVQNVPAAMIEFKSYSMSLFQALMMQDCADQVQLSTNPYKNLNKIYQNVQSDGGRSGQFFFFTYDNRILLKTITQKQLNVLLQRLQDYYNYFINHRQSFIVKIYGVFTATNPETQQSIHFMMMGNLLQDINRKYVHRIYDCKGSSHQREVFKQMKQQQQPQYSQKTMKDLDFSKLQSKVWIKKQSSNHIKQILKQDSLFFLENRLIDYSLIIIKIDYKKYCSELEGKKPTFNSRTMFYNEKQPNMIYILGIIDYLETWNVKKKGQRWYKSLFTHSDTISSQSPNFYCQRFCQNLIQKIFV